MLLAVYDKVFGGIQSGHEFNNDFEKGNTHTSSAKGGSSCAVRGASDSKYDQLMSQPLDKLLGLTPSFRLSERPGQTLMEKHRENSQRRVNGAGLMKKGLARNAMSACGPRRKHSGLNASKKGIRINMEGSGVILGNAMAIDDSFRKEPETTGGPEGGGTFSVQTPG